MGRGVNHLYQVLANQPAALEAFLGMSRYIRDDSSLRPALREMAILATAEALDQPYEIAHHRPAALQSGVTPGKIDTILAGETHELAPVARAVGTFALQVAQERKVDDAAFGELPSSFSHPSLPHIPLTVPCSSLFSSLFCPLP